MTESASSTHAASEMRATETLSVQIAARDARGFRSAFNDFEVDPETLQEVLALLADKNRVEARKARARSRFLPREIAQLLGRL